MNLLSHSLGLMQEPSGPRTNPLLQKHPVGIENFFMKLNKFKNFIKPLTHSLVQIMSSS